MRYALFQGCNIPARVEQYANATEAVAAKLDIELVEITEFNCCGYPARNTDHRAFVLSAARNLALAERAGLDMLVMCKCCYGSLKKAEHYLNQDQDLITEINKFLAKENLEYKNKIKVKHLLSVLYHDVGIDRLKGSISKTYSGLQIAASYGCHALRPSNVTGFDDPVAPRIFDDLVEVTGAFSVDWARKLDCCGAPLTGINDRLAMDMAQEKITSAREAGAHFICTACPYTHLQFDVVQTHLASNPENGQPLAPILYPQLLGLCLGIDEKTLGISENEIDLSGITSFLMAE
jgi:heterodisulfide reductase subunit B